MKRLAALLFCIALPAYGTPIDFQVRLTVASTSVVDYHETHSSVPPLGEQFFALVTVDNSILQTNGAQVPGIVLGFRAEMGSIIWDMQKPMGLGNDFRGFRGPCNDTTPDPNGYWHLNSKCLGFTVENHEVTGLLGGVWGPGDWTFIDFHGDRYNAQASFDGIGPGNGPVSRNEGPLDIALVPEPSTLVLVLAVWWIRRMTT